MKNLKPLKAYLFDVDGVLTNPEVKKVEQLKIFDELEKRLEIGYPVGLNTGRSLKFIIEQILKPLEKRVTNKLLFQKLFAIGEKGGTWIYYDKSGLQKVKIDKNVSIPKEIQNKVQILINTTRYSDVMFYDETKKTMISVELKHGRKIAEFQEPQNRLVDELKTILMDLGLDNKFKVDPTRIATDVENIYVGKGLGARKFIDLLQEKNIHPQEYLGFGDSTSDYDMFEELQRLGKRAKFVFVGDKKHLVGKPQKGVLYTDQPVDKGTLTFLQAEG